MMPDQDNRTAADGGAYPGRRRRRGNRRIGAALLATVLALGGCANRGPEVAPTGAPVDPPSVPAPTTAAPASTSAAAALASPVDEADVRHCEVFRGTSRLPADKTLVLGVRNLDNGSPERYFQTVKNWEYPQDLGQWVGHQWFGSGNSSVGQRYRVELLIVDVALVEAAAIKAAKEGWHAPRNPKGATVAAHITLKRVAGGGPAQCS